MADSGPVLIVEDEKDLREALALLIRQRGYRVETAAEADEALAKIAAHRPSLILLNLRMPGMGGAKLREQLLERTDTAEIPVVLLSASINIAAEARRLLAADYLQKPVDFARLEAVLKTYCGS